MYRKPFYDFNDARKLLTAYIEKANLRDPEATGSRKNEVRLDPNIASILGQKPAMDQETIRLDLVFKE